MSGYFLGFVGRFRQKSRLEGGILGRGCGGLLGIHGAICRRRLGSAYRERCRRFGWHKGVLKSIGEWT